MPDFLLELGTEEIPARMLDGASAELKRRVGELLARERLGGEGVSIDAFSTPRRLAVLAQGMLAQQPDAEEVLQGPAAKVAFKDGKPTAAAEAFAKKAGTPVSELQTVTTPKGEYLSAKVTRRGRSAKEILTDLLPKEIAGLYWAKSMYWRKGKPERFVRPLRWMVAMLDSDIVPIEFGGVAAGRNTRGHRVLTLNAEYSLGSVGEYRTALEDMFVVADPKERRFQIAQEMDELAAARLLRLRRDEELLDTVVNLTESPGVIMGSFDHEYLSLPEEILVTVMRDHQKYFALDDCDGKLAPNFLAVLNIDASGEAKDLITHGNERVLRARFNDARFFWKTDQRIPLLERGPMLQAVTFQKDLGSYAAKTERMRRLVAWMAQQIDCDAGAAETATTLAKADLTTELVKEFTELQGIVGGLYARAQGHTEAVANAIYDHYKPLSVESEVPRTKEGALVAIADKADSIAGMFALGSIPSGSKDPFALRRAANGIIKIIHQHRLPYSIAQLMDEAAASYDDPVTGTGIIAKSELYYEHVRDFFRERLEFYLRDVLKHAYDEVNAVLAANSPDDVNDAITRTEALSVVRASADFEAISLSFKRIKNILRQAAEKGIAPAENFDSNLLRESEEKELDAKAEQVATQAREAQSRRAYGQALNAIATIRSALDRFFEKVMVMVDDPKLRAQRLALLSRIIAEFSTIADFSEIVTQSDKKP
ncbi:MAG: glycine--tRNA ligase subunit beta [Acidobacteriaceae bacterium]